MNKTYEDLLALFYRKGYHEGFSDGVEEIKRLTDRVVKKYLERAKKQLSEINKELGTKTDEEANKEGTVKEA